MSIVVPLWVVLLIVTLAIWGGVMLLPSPDPLGIMAFLYLVAATIASLLLWLVYFAVT